MQKKGKRERKKEERAHGVEVVVRYKQQNFYCPAAHRRAFQRIHTSNPGAERWKKLVGPYECWACLLGFNGMFYVKLNVIINIIKNLYTKSNSYDPNFFVSDHHLVTYLTNTLTDNEITFLSKGPKFALSQPVNDKTIRDATVNFCRLSNELRLKEHWRRIDARNSGTGLPSKPGP